MATGVLQLDGVTAYADAMEIRHRAYAYITNGRRLLALPSLADYGDKIDLLIESLTDPA